MSLAIDSVRGKSKKAFCSHPAAAEAATVGAHYELKGQSRSLFRR
jgi:acyl-coenzyme A synthetase/AMP-(fatty) acid ligase